MKPTVLSFLCLLYAFNVNLSYAATECFDVVSTPAISGCFVEEQEKAERELNATIQRFVSQAQYKGISGLVEKFRQAQQTWIEFRKYNCDFYGHMDRARDSFGQANCMLRLTRERELDLRKVEMSLDY